MIAPAAYGSSQARDQIQATDATYATAVAMPDNLTHCTMQVVESIQPQMSLRFVNHCATVGTLEYGFFFFLCLFRAAPEAYGGSQARGLIGVTATATWDPSLVCELHHNSGQHQILNPLSKAKD